MTRNEIEQALTDGTLWAAMRNGRFWRARRNGRTQTWKRDPSRFSVPIKAGLKSYARLTETDQVTRAPDLSGVFVISETDPNG